MDEKKMVYIIIALLVCGCFGVLYMVVPWLLGRGFSNWKELLFNDGLIASFFIIVGYGIYLGTRTHKK